MKMDNHDIGAMFKRPGLPCAFLSFAEKQKPPYLIWGRMGSSDFYADNHNFMAVTECYLELYMKQYEPALLSEIESKLQAERIPYEREHELYIEKTELYLCRWSFSIIGA